MPQIFLPPYANQSRLWAHLGKKKHLYFQAGITLCSSSHIMCMLHSLIHVAGVKGQDKFKVTVVILANTIRIVPYWRLQKQRAD